MAEQWVGNSLSVLLDVDGVEELIEMDIICPSCGNGGFYLSNDYKLLCCGACGNPMGRRSKDFSMEVGWRV